MEHSRIPRKSTALAAALFCGAGLAVLAPHAAQAHADACPDVEVAFARGTNEPPGLGYMGEYFVDGLRERLPGKAIDAYAVDYPAVLSPESLGDGGNDLSQHVQNVARSCPSTKIVLGGFSQGAGVVDLVTVSPLPTQSINLPILGEVSLADTGFDQPLPTNVFPHIAAVAVFGNPVKHVYDGVLPMPDGLRSRTDDECADGDPVCHLPGPDDLSNFHNHDSYIDRGLTDKAADFVVQHLGLRPNPPKTPTTSSSPDDDAFRPIQTPPPSDDDEEDGDN
ncbi:cutinase [Segniliparus rotundus DSM 44985]|uniref:Cutinase n=1 Tax=Segniliparus rotundus (strain ATCC BAA-972 / CDC 1076 / CIP 108378 / DSM 44985 / JCM 13578) TaxID=640132 RepID=D6ZA90_SEGRD|nr:cutinase family protein [Segniliparus rotundus]ADG96632.1 cutinase [Segniliparus rotundus DSM 44985]